MAKKKLHKLNGEIRFPEVRIIGNEERLVMSSYEAYNLAQERDLDLILINETSNPPVVKIEEYTKFLYNITKKMKEQKKNSTASELKEIQLSPNIADNDLNTKVKKSIEFLTRGDKVKCVLVLKGREKAMPEKGELVMLKFATMLEEVGTPEKMPVLESSKWFMIIKPKKK